LKLRLGTHRYGAKRTVFREFQSFKPFQTFKPFKSGGKNRNLHRRERSSKNIYRSKSILSFVEGTPSTPSSEVQFLGVLCVFAEDILVFGYDTAAQVLCGEVLLGLRGSRQAGSVSASP
jgi:hypothetical protein